MSAGLGAGAVRLDGFQFLVNGWSGVSARTGIDGRFVPGLFFLPFLLVVSAGGDSVFPVEFTVVVGVVAARLGGGKRAPSSSEKARLAVAASFKVFAGGNDGLSIESGLGGLVGLLSHNKGVAGFHHFRKYYLLLKFQIWNFSSDRADKICK